MSTSDLSHILSEALRDANLSYIDTTELHRNINLLYPIAYQRELVERQREYMRTDIEQPQMWAYEFNPPVGNGSNNNFESNNDRRQRENDKYFRESKDICHEASRLDSWQDKNGRKHKIKKMKINELDEAYKQLKDGWFCRGQRHKIYSIERVLNEKRGGAQLMVV